MTDIAETAETRGDPFRTAMVEFQQSLDFALIRSLIVDSPGGYELSTDELSLLDRARLSPRPWVRDCQTENEVGKAVQMGATFLKWHTNSTKLWRGPKDNQPGGGQGRWLLGFNAYPLAKATQLPDITISKNRNQGNSRTLLAENGDLPQVKDAHAYYLITTKNIRLLTRFGQGDGSNGFIRLTIPGEEAGKTDRVYLVQDKKGQDSRFDFHRTDRTRTGVARYLVPAGSRLEYRFHPRVNHQNASYRMNFRASVIRFDIQMNIWDGLGSRVPNPDAPLHWAPQDHIPLWT